MTNNNVHIKEVKERYIFRHNFPDVSVEKLKYRLRTVSRDSIKNSSDSNNAYDSFIKIFRSLYDECFLKKEIESKPLNRNNPWITEGIEKTSERKQKLYGKFLKKQK